MIRRTLSNSEINWFNVENVAQIERSVEKLI